MPEKDEESLKRYATEIGVPGYMQESLIQYILTGRPVGHFLTAVLSNDLKEAVARADEVNQWALSKYVIFLHNHAPIGSWGSPENVKRWKEIGGLRGVLKHAEEVKAEQSKPDGV